MLLGNLYNLRRAGTCRSENFILIVALSAIMVASFHTHASMPVKYAGFAYAGDFVDMKLNYPLSYELSKIPSDANPDVPLLDALLLERLAKNMPTGIDLNITESGRISSGHTVAMAFVLYRESLTSERFTDVYKIVANIGAQAFFYDIKEKTCIASYPVNLQYIDITDEEPDAEYKLKTIRNLYEGEDFNIFDDFVDQIHDITLEEMTGNRIGISRVSLQKALAEYLPEHFLKDTANLKDILANHLSMSFAQNQRVSVLPYSSAVDGKMRMHFGDISSFTELFKIPEPDYHIQLELHRFLKELEDGTPIEKLYLYGAVVRILILHPDSSTTFMDLGLQLAIPNKVPTSQLEVSDWPIFEETLLALFDDITIALTNPSKSWADTHLAITKNKPKPKASIAVKQMRTAKGVLDKCR